ncbi:MAG: hypothetical protein NVS9B1_17890 [Candidatus Dormibacteraceae bacterium]
MVSLRTATVAGIALALLLAGLAMLLRAPVVGAPTGAVLVVFTGAVQVAPAGGAARVIGPVVTTSPSRSPSPDPATRAAVVGAAGAVRLDSNSIVTIRHGGVLVAAGRTWIRSAPGRTLVVAGAGGVSAGGSEFRVEAPAGGSSRVIAVTGGVAVSGRRFSTRLDVGKAIEVDPGGAARAAAPPAADGWTTFNVALDENAGVGQSAPAGAGPGAAIAVGSGFLGGGEQSSLQQAVEVQVAAGVDILFSIDWPQGGFELSIIGPDGAVTQSQGSEAPPMVITIPRAAAGSWQYRVRNAGDGASVLPWTVVVTTISPARALN